MDWQNLRHFLAVAESGSLAGAARRLQVSKATVWRHVRALQEFLGVTL
ncbi:MAG: LysR family transcriptional regulator, partial [Proteobacteria bacterium]|nr:LysR family transcriptional regulator [Pseudomonadota bacterium]